MLLHGDVRSRLIVGAMAVIIAFAAIPNAQASPRSGYIGEAIPVIVKIPTKRAKRKGTSAGPRGFASHGGAWHWTPHRAMTKAQIVLAVARQQLGKPYVWAADGPSAFDCSGLTMYVWHAAGVDLPHNSWAQQDVTKPVPVDKMQPGDLVFYPGHVGIYIGHGQMIHAPHTGANVEIAPLQSDIIGAGRPA